MTSTNRPSHGGSPGHHYSAGEMHNPEVEHEHSDVNVRQILMFGVGMAVVTILCALVVRGVFGVLERQAAANDPQVSPLATPPGQLPPAPNLQTNEPAGLKKVRQMETETLEGYGWVDQGTGVARVPIADAKKLLLQRGLPVRAGAATDTLEGTHAPAMGESSGGRAIHIPKGTATGAGQAPAAPGGAAAEIKK
jgi:hypothetical protein